MTAIPRVSHSKAERRVKVDIFPDIKPRRGAIENTNPDTSATPDRDKVVLKYQYTTISTARVRSRDQTRQAAGRSGGIFEAAANAITPWELQYTITENSQKAFVPTDKSFSLEISTNEDSKENVIPQISLPIIAFGDNPRLPKEYKDEELKLLGACPHTTLSLKTTQAHHRSFSAMVHAVTSQPELFDEKKQGFSTNVAEYHVKRCEREPDMVEQALEGGKAGSMPITTNKSSMYDDEHTLKELSIKFPIQTPTDSTKHVPMIQQVNGNSSFPPRADEYGTNTELVQCLSEQNSFGSDTSPRPRSQVIQEDTSRSYSVEY